MTVSELKRRYRNGASVQILAELEDCSIADIRLALGLDEPVVAKSKVSNESRWDLYKQGFSDSEIGEKQGVSKRAITAWRNKNQLPPNPSKKRRMKIEQIEKLYHQGMTDRAISEEVGCDRSTVYQWRKQNGLPATYGRRAK